MSSTETAPAPAKKRGRKTKAEATTTETPADGPKINDLGVLRLQAPVDWKSFIPEEFIEIQTDWYLKQGINPSTLTPEERKELKARAGEENQLIRLGGFKYLAHLRGISHLEYKVESLSDDKVSAQCFIAVQDEFDPNKTKTFSGMANASKENTSYPFSMFLESMAENRAFIRAVKAACNINVLGVEEMQNKPSQVTQDALLSDDEGCTSPQDSLRILVEQKNKTFSDLKQNLLKKEWEGADSWNDFKDVPADQCLLIIETIQSKPAKG